MLDERATVLTESWSQGLYHGGAHRPSVQTETQLPVEMLGKMQPWKAELVTKSRTLSKMALRVFRKGGSSETVGNYAKDVSLFCKWVEMGPDEAVEAGLDWPKVVNDYLDYYVVKQGNAKTSSRTMVAAIKKWLETNEVLSTRDLAWQKVDMPKYQRSETDQIPTKLEVRAALSGGGARDRALVLMAISSGLRRGSLLALRFKDVDLSREIPLIRPRPETTKGKARHFTFCTPEAKQALEVYKRERELRGETITPDSYIFTVERPQGQPYMSGNQASARWVELLKKAGLNEKGHRHSKMHFHILRKFFSTWSKLTGVNSEVVEFFEGHRSTLPQVYFVGDAENVPEEVIQKLEAEYKKAVSALTVMSDEDKIRNLEGQLEEQARELSELRGSLIQSAEGTKDILVEIIKIAKEHPELGRALRETLEKAKD